MITLHVPQPQLLLTPLVFYNMHAGKITLIGKIPDSYSVFDMSDIRLSILNLACFPLEVPFCISLALGPPLGRHVQLSMATSHYQISFQT